MKILTPEQQRKRIDDIRDKRIPWRTRQPDKLRRACWIIVMSALAKGELVPAENCERCGGKTKGRKLDGHHADYNKPLDVEWLCRTCHRNHHLEN